MGKLNVDFAALSAASTRLSTISTTLDAESTTKGLDADFGSDTVIAAHDQMTRVHERAANALVQTIGSLGTWVQSAGEEFERQDARLADEAK